MVKDREAWHAAVSPWGHKESDMTEGMNNKAIYIHTHIYFLIILKESPFIGKQPLIYLLRKC